MMHYREEGRIYCYFSCFVFTRVEKRKGGRGGEGGRGERSGRNELGKKGGRQTLLV